MCVCSTSPHSRGRGGDNRKREQCRFPLPLSLSPPLLLSHSFLCSSSIATAIRTRPPSLATILLGYAIHIPPTETNWCWRPTVTLLSLGLDADPYCHSDCLTLRLPLPLHSLLHETLPLSLLFWNITCPTPSGTCTFLPSSGEAGCHRDPIS